MLKRVIITNYRGESMEYAIEGVEIDNPSGLFITSIEGLGPVKANINMTELTTTDGSLYNSARLTSRNIVIKGYFTTASSIEEARLLSYKYFPIKKKLTFHIETDNRIAETTGYVESNEPDIFSKQEGVQISVLCESAFFDAADENAEQVIRFSSTIPLFKFPYKNYSAEVGVEGDTLRMMNYGSHSGTKLTLLPPSGGSITCSSGRLSIRPNYAKETKFGEFVSRRESKVTYDGDSEVGINLKAHFKGDVEKLTIYNGYTGEHMTIDASKLSSVISGASSKFIAGDTVEICTLQTKKSMILIRDAVEYNILNLLDKNSDWFKIAKGENIFIYILNDSESGYEDLIELTIVVGKIYEGV